MIVLIEGPDGSGKSTLIEKVFKLNKFHVIHNGVYPTPHSAYSSYIQQIEEENTLEHGIVFDRLHISQAIYGPIMRDENPEYVLHNIVDNMLYDRKAVVVLCQTKASLINWEKRNKEKLEYVTDLVKFVKIMNCYRNIRSYTRLPFVTYDYTNVQGNELIPILERIEVIRENCYVY